MSTFVYPPNLHLLFSLRPHGLKELCCRLMIDLPDAENRAKILRVILAEEDVSSDFNVDELAAATDGYSGSDLKVRNFSFPSKSWFIVFDQSYLNSLFSSSSQSLCTTAAYRRIRELLDKEKKVF